MLEFLYRPWLDSSEQILITFALVGVLIGLLTLTGLLGRLAGVGLRFVNAILTAGFQIWEVFFARLHWALLLGIVLVVQAFAWFGQEPFPLAALLIGCFLLAVGVTACMAYIVIDQERFDVTRGYKVLHSPGKGQELAERLLRHGPQVGLALLVVACLATLTGFTLFNLGMYDWLGPKWCTVGDQRRTTPVEEVAPDGPTVQRPAHYSDFLAYGLLHLISALDLIDLLNHTRLARIAYIHPSNPVAVAGQTLFRLFFTAVLLRQLFAWYRDRRLLTDSLRDFWSAPEPIQRRASETLAQQGVAAAQALLRSVQTAARLTPEQQALLPDVLAAAGPAVVPLLIRGLKQPQEMVREISVAALGRLQAIEALPELERAASDPVNRVRLRVAVTLGEVFAPGPVAVRKRWKLRYGGRRRRGWATFSRTPPELASDPAHRGVVVLRRLATDPARSVRVAALDALRSLGKEAGAAVADLVALATDESEEVRQRVAAALGAAGKAAGVAVPALLRLLEDPIPAVRLAAAQAVGEFGEEAAPAIPVLIPLLQDSEAGIRQAAAAAIADIGTLDARSLPRLIAALRSQDNLVQARAAEAMGTIGPPAAAAMPALVELLQDDSDLVRLRAAWALGRMAEASAASALGAALSDEDFRVAAEAAAALGELGPAASAALPALLDAARHINALVRKNTAAALRAVGEGNRIVPVLLTLADDSEVEVQLEALASLGQQAEPAARKRLIAALRDSHPRVRVAAVRALQRDGLAAVDLIRVLLPLLDDASEEVVLEVLAALGQLEHPPPEVVLRLAELLQDSREDVQVAAARALGQFGRDAAPVTASLLRALERGAASVREQSLRTLLQAESPELLGACLAALHDTDEAVRRLASAGLVLAAPVPADALPAIAEGMKDSDVQVRSNLAMVLARQELLPVTVIPFLMRALEDPDDGLRLNALRALQERPDTLAQALPRLLADPNGQVALLAASCTLHGDPRDPDAVALLKKAIASEAARDRRHALETLQRLQRDPERFTEALSRQLTVEAEPELRDTMIRLLEAWQAQQEA